MIIVALLIGISLLIALGFLAFFFWNIRSGQYEDLFTPSVRILFDDAERPAEAKDSDVKGDSR